MSVVVIATETAKTSQNANQNTFHSLQYDKLKGKIQQI